MNSKLLLLFDVAKQKEEKNLLRSKKKSYNIKNKKQQKKVTSVVKGKTVNVLMKVGSSKTPSYLHETLCHWQFVKESFSIIVYLLQFQ